MTANVNFTYILSCMSIMRQCQMRTVLHIQKTFISNDKKISTPGPISKHWIRFCHISSEYYDLDLNFDETEKKNKSDHSPKDKGKLFHENIVVIQE